MRGMSFFSRSVAFIFLFATVSTARPGIRHIDYGLLHGRSPHDATTLNNQLWGLEEPLSASAHTSSKRMMPGFTPVAGAIKMNMVNFKKIRPIIPIHKAASFLQDFYSQVAFQAGSVWASLPPRQHFNIREGNFELMFTAIGDYIPWHVVKELADRLWQCAVLGLTDLFEATYFDQTGRIGLKVVLSIVDSSLSSEGDDFREGSVPSVNGPDMSYQLEDPGTRR